MSWNKNLDNPETTENPATDGWIGNIDTDFIDAKLDEYEKRKCKSEIASNSSSSEAIGIVDAYTDEELAQLWDDDFGEANEKVINYNDPEYIKSGLLKPNWSKDSVDGSEITILPEGTRIAQYAHPGSSGTYFAPEGTEYADLQLPDSADKRILTVYEVQKGGLQVEQSEIAIQPWNEPQDSPEGTGTLQYKTVENASILLSQGKLKIIDPSNN